MATAFQCAAPATAQTLAPSAPIPQTSRAFTGLFQDIGTDFRNLASKDTLTVLAVGGLMAAALHRVDQPATTMLSGSKEGLYSSGETIGSARLQFGSALATLAVGRLTGSPKLTAVGADLVSANIVAQTLTTGIKIAARRTRPDGTEFSFPSGHTSVSFAAATVLQRHFGWKAGAPAYAMASFVAASRIHEKRHFLSDVTFGAAVGIVSGWAVTVGHGKTQMSVAPIAAPGGGGIGFTWTGQ
jgi:membrane-associated phospholipid phosphatase